MQEIKLKGRTLVLINLNKYDSFVFLFGDGDYVPLYKYLVRKRKQIVIIYEKGHVGREVWELPKSYFRTRFSYLMQK